MAGFNTFTGGRAENIADPATGINTGEFYDRLLLETAWEKFIISNFTAKKTSPKYEGDGVVFSRYEPLATFETPLLEGQQGSGQKLDKVNVRGKLNTYGSSVTLTDDLLTYGEDSSRIKKDVVQNLGNAAGQTQENLIINTILGDSTQIVFDSDLDKTLKTAELALRNALATKFTSMVTGSTKYSTTPIRPAYVGFVTPEGALKLEDELAGFVPVEKYGYSDGLLPNEIGSYRGVRYCETTLMKDTAGGTLQAIILGEEAVAEVGIRGMKKVETIIKDLGEAEGGDYLNRTASIGSKFKATSITLRNDWVITVELEANP
jgi:N4-gp56 family major capsid protein